MSTVLLIKKLCEEYGYDEKELAKLNKEQLEDMITMENNDAVEIEQDDLVPMPEDNSNIQDVPEITSPLWNDYVLSQFASEELRGGNPTVDGLRRVTQLLIGDVIECDTQVVQSPSIENEARATVVVSVVIVKKHGVIARYSGAADAYHGNIQPGFERYPVALAETRAEGRAYRKALRLRNIAAEEAGVNPETSADESKLLVPMNAGQVTAIDVVSRGSNLNVEKVIKYLKEKNVIEYNDIKKLTESDGQQIMKSVSGFNGDRASIPKELLGYIPDWRKNV